MVRRQSSGPLRHPSAIPIAAAAVAYAWWTAGLAPFTWPALVAVEAAGIAAMITGTHRRRPYRSCDHKAGGTWIWAMLFVLLAGWELAAYVQHPRSDHPTLSSLLDQALDWRPARAGALLVWLAVGADLARR